MGMPKVTPLPHWRERSWTDRRGRTHVAYYYEHPRDESGKKKVTPLGTDRIKALVEYAKLQKVGQDKVGLTTDDFSAQAVYTRYMAWAEVISQSQLAPRTIADRRKYWASLGPVFGRCHIDTLTPDMMIRYFDARSSKVTAKKEIKFLSVMCGWARARGWMKGANPVTRDVLRLMKVDESRDVYVPDSLYWLVYDCADQLVQDTLDFMLLNYLRPSEALKAPITAIHRGPDGTEEIWHTMPKTRRSGVRIKRVRVTGRLAAVLEHMRERQRAAKVRGMTILADEDGQPLTLQGKLRSRFYKARDRAKAKLRTWQAEHGDQWLIDRELPVPPAIEDGVKEPQWLEFQMRDMRPKSATDSARRDGMPATRNKLGHTTEKQTADYVRDHIGELVDPAVIERPDWMDGESTFAKTA